MTILTSSPGFAFLFSGKSRVENESHVDVDLGRRDDDNEPAGGREPRCQFRDEPGS
jgi:hypothetical protein